MDDEAGLPDALVSTSRRFHQLPIYDAPQWYDADYAGYRGEHSFYRNLLSSFLVGDAVAVELGAGTGRLTIPFAQSGHRVYAVEPAPRMRSHLMQKAAAANVTLPSELALASSFRGPEGSRISFAYFPFNGLLHIGSRAELRATFVHIHQRLAPGGHFAFDVTSPYWESMARGRTAWGRVDERIHPVSGRRFVTCDRSTYDSATRVMHIDIRYAYVDDDSDGIQTSLQQHMWTYVELLSCLWETGFEPETLMGDVDGAAFDDGSPRLLVCAAARTGRSTSRDRHPRASAAATNAAHE